MEEIVLVEPIHPVVIDRRRPAAESPAGTLYLAPPLSGAQRAIRSTLRGLETGYEELRLGTIVVRVETLAAARTRASRSSRSEGRRTRTLRM